MTNPINTVSRWRRRRNERLGKEQVRERRVVALVSITTGPLIMWVLNAVRATDSSPRITEGEILFFDTAGWHWLLTKESLVLDAVVISLCFWLLFWLLATKLAGSGSEEAIEARKKYSNRQRARHTILVALGFAAGIGSFGGAVGTAMSGRASSIEWAIIFVVVFGGITLACIILACAIVLVIAGSGVALHKAWKVIRPLRVFSPFRALGRYLDAEDVPAKEVAEPLKTDHH